LSILVLDDEPFMLGLIGHVLAELGFDRVQACDCGVKALERVAMAETTPDLILLDLNMPGMDGVEFVRRLVEHDYAGSLVLVSGEDKRVLHMAEKLITAHRIKVVGHLQKPFTLESVEAIMKSCRALQVRPRSALGRLYNADDLGIAIVDGQLVNFYQPKVDVATGAVAGVETLVRWQHPEDGLVYPGQFIGIAEESGWIDDLTRTVLRQAMRQCRAWRDEGLELRVAVNVSMDNLSSVDFAGFVAQQAEEAGVSPHDIMLELTESRLMLDQRAPLEGLTRLRMRRFGLSIDDFGTGHSSLSQLRDIPFDEMKIDRTFVHGAWRDETAQAIYTASLNLGRQLGMTVVAEGVEDREDWALLQRSGCHHAQGYFIARPMPAAELPEWLASWSKRLCDWDGDPSAE
jgi:EAL domain-containing protein (putative c-di-GMP-specific phosphodiesterase class I)/AmiR/NasT family two-component response regulator